MSAASTALASTMYSPAQLARLLRLPEPTPEQAAVIGAPLGPMAVIAGAGSGKSETMAARLVWLVANGRGRPERVLGLTFTRKAAAELADRVRARLDRLRGGPATAGLRTTGLRTTGLQTAGPQAPAAESPAAESPAEDGPGAWAGDPVIGTYHAYAGRLVSDHALREGIEPSLRLITPAPSWQLAASIVAAYDGPMDEIGWTPQTVTAAVIQLSGDLAEHLREPADVTGVGEWLATRYAALPRKTAAAKKILDSQRPVSNCCRWSAGTRRPRPRGRSLTTAIKWRSPPGSRPGIPRWGRPSVAGTRWSCWTSTRTPATRSSCCSGRSSAAAIRLPLSVTRASRSYGGGAPARATCGGSPGTFPRGPGRRRQYACCPRASVIRGRCSMPPRSCRRSCGRRHRMSPLLVPAPDRVARGAVTCALLPTVSDEADWVADEAARLLALPAGSAPDGRPWPDGRAARRPALRHCGPVPQAVAVRGAAPGTGGARHPVRGGGPRRPARRAGGPGRGGDAARDARRLGVRRPRAHPDRAALADRPP